jgi:hypothetical protein
MSIRRVLAALVAVLLTAGTFVALNPATASSSPPAARSGKTVFFDMYYNPKVAPKRIFMTANSGPWMKNLHWDGWGTGTAVGHGAWISDCASCPGPDRRQVKITFTKRIYCKAQGVHTYRKARVVLSEPDEGYTNRTFSFWNRCPPS